MHTEEELRFLVSEQLVRVPGDRVPFSLLAHIVCGGRVRNLSKREKLLELQDFTSDIIHSMRGGLVTTDMEGAGGAAEPDGREILGERLRSCAGGICGK